MADPTTVADHAGKAIADAIIALSAAIQNAGLPAPIAIVMPDRPALHRLEFTIMHAMQPWLTPDPDLRGQATKINNVELRSNLS